MDSTSPVPSEDVTDVIEKPSQALVKTSMRALDGQYRPPKPGRSLRTGMRTLVLLGGSVAIGTGVAMGAFGVLPAAMMAVGLATAQVVAQSMYQNRLGQNVMGGIARGDLDQALHAAEKALEESPTGAMRTLAASNLASVLMQADRVHDGARVLDRYPPGRIGSIPLSTVLWLNNRAFAHVVLNDQSATATALLDEAQARLKKAGTRGFGGLHNQRKIAAALASTCAMERLAHDDPKAALRYLEESQQLDDSMRAAFRTAELELCRAEALRRLGRHDEAILTVIELRDSDLTERQHEVLRVLEEKVNVRSKGASDVSQPELRSSAYEAFGDLPDPLGV